MGTSPGSPGGSSITINSPSADKLRKRRVHGSGDNFAADSGKASAGKPYSNEDIEEIIQQLPDWKSQLSLRGYIVGERRSSLSSSSSSAAALVLAGQQLSIACYRLCTMHRSSDMTQHMADVSFGSRMAAASIADNSKCASLEQAPPATHGCMASDTLL